MQHRNSHDAASVEARRRRRPPRPGLLGVAAVVYVVLMAGFAVLCLALARLEPFLAGPGIVAAVLAALSVPLAVFAFQIRRPGPRAQKLGGPAAVITAVAGAVGGIGSVAGAVVAVLGTGTASMLPHYLSLFWIAVLIVVTGLQIRQAAHERAKPTVGAGGA